MATTCGKLYIVSTPIGNLSDITYRAVETLKSVDIVACEDTRHTTELLNHFDIKTKTISCHEHNESEKSSYIIEELRNGKNIALVTDAGTPIISDPGFSVVKLAREEGVDVTAIPGACAAINALVLSGIDARTFTFIGFLPEDNKRRKNIIDSVKKEKKTMIFYISPHNLLSDITTLIEAFGEERKAAILREMTKIHEEYVYDSLSNIKDYYLTKAIKGEFVIVVEGDTTIDDKENMWKDMSIERHIKFYEEMGLSEKEAMKKVAVDRNIDKRDIYRQLKIK